MVFDMDGSLYVLKTLVLEPMIYIPSSSFTRSTCDPAVQLDKYHHIPKLLGSIRQIDFSGHE